MTIKAAVRSATVLLLVVGLAACAQRPTGAPPTADATPPPDAALPGDPADLVLRVEHVGGFVTPETTLGRIPSFSLYADGRLITDGPVPAIYPGPALPNVQVQLVDEATVRDLAGQALAAGVAEDTDLGRPPIADMPSTRFTLVTADDTHVREVYALHAVPFEGDEPADGLTPEQHAARAELLGLVTALGDLGQQLTPEGQVPVEPYQPESVAAIVRPWTAPEYDIGPDMVPDAVPWPGPELPGEPVGRLPALSCVTATGEEAEAVLTAARDANALTPWASADGTRWSVAFRPLLPDESGCADLVE